MGVFRPSKAARRAMPGHGRSLFADGGIAVVPYLYDNELVLRFDGVRPARFAVESCAVPTRLQRRFHVAHLRFQRASNAPCTRFSRPYSARWFNLRLILSTDRKITVRARCARTLDGLSFSLTYW